MEEKKKRHYDDLWQEKDTDVAGRDTQPKPHKINAHIYTLYIYIYITFKSKNRLTVN